MLFTKDSNIKTFLKTMFLNPSYDMVHFMDHHMDKYNNKIFLK